MNIEERNKKIELYGNGFDMLVHVLKDIPREMWKFKPATLNGKPVRGRYEDVMPTHRLVDVRSSLGTNIPCALWPSGNIG